MGTAAGTFEQSAGGGHLRGGWPGRHEREPREMRCGCELHAPSSQVPQGCLPSQGSSSGRTALCIPWPPGAQRLG